MREVLSTYLSAKAKQDPNLYVFSGDHGYALFDTIRKQTPDQFINVGVSEQAMVGYAAGMVKEGMKAFVYGLAAFIPIRVLEFIKMDVCYDNLPIIFLGDGAGLVYANLGASHQCAEDISSLRALPNIKIYSPADSYEMQACLDHAYHSPFPSYIRIGKSDKARVHTSDFPLVSDRLLLIKNYPTKNCIVATGSMLSVALELSEKYKITVFSAPSLTDLNAERLLLDLSPFDKIISMEEHSIQGGLGSILTELIMQSVVQKKQQLLRIGIRNRFTQKCGSYEYAMMEHGLDFASVENELLEKSMLI
ncbi:transketolase [Leptospira ognonensis]|uniref:Transketolase n=1 Tax=Leptospira ognonensis TaxID=2484945 RepID=A0A4R9JZM8_9LEPT|nr:transketolase C-terminal domain-containing protein [Leptospira ognonensis]TGL57199.1 transketolase [Leptospira ognonensis]